MTLDSAMLASSLRRLPTNDNDATVLAGVLRSAALPAVVRAASSSATPTTTASSSSEQCILERTFGVFKSVFLRYLRAYLKAH